MFLLLSIVASLCMSQIGTVKKNITVFQNINDFVFNVFVVRKYSVFLGRVLQGGNPF